MKILFVATVYRHIRLFHIPYIEYFQSLGYEVWAAGTGEDKEILENIGVICVDVPFSRNPFSFKNAIAFCYLNILFKMIDFELIDIHTPVAALVTRAAHRKKQPGKIIYTAHGFHFFKGAPLFNWILYYSAEKIATKWTDHLITINQEDYENALKIGLSKERISYIYGKGVEVPTVHMSGEERLALRKELEIRENSVVISYIAELNKNKNHQFLLKNWNEIKLLSPNAILLIIGKGNYEDELKRYVLEKNINDVKFLGFRSNIHQLLELSDIVTLLSHREGLPKSIMEAMVAKLPVVVTDTRGLRDLIINNENGFVVSHEDKIGLINAFVSLINNENLRKQMGENGFEKVQKYRLENVLKEYSFIYEDLLRKDG